MTTGGRVAIVGGAGRLGTAVCHALIGSAWDVTIVDRSVQRRPRRGVELRTADLGDPCSLDAALAGVDAVVHLAGLHGAHLVAGVAPRAVWAVNVDGTANLLRSALGGGVRRLVFASSTSVYGPGSPPGCPARVLDESTVPVADDVYDLSKLTGERMVRQLRANGQIDTVVLRFGRFWFGSARDYHLRKLSTGVDVEDAAAAVRRVLERPDLPDDVYCVASDLDLDGDERAALGRNLTGVVVRHAPALPAALDALGWELPPRVGKSVATTALQQATGYRPQRTLRWWSEQLGVASPTAPPDLLSHSGGSWAHTRYSTHGARAHA